MSKGMHEEALAGFGGVVQNGGGSGSQLVVSVLVKGGGLLLALVATQHRIS